MKGEKIMLKETREEKEIRIFNHYKSRLKKLDSEKIRFSTIEYLCYFPKIDPFKMAAALSRDASISAEKNKRKEKNLKKLLKTA